MIKIVAESILKREEDLEIILDWYKELVEATKKEKGCIEYDLFQGVQNKKSITMIEYWETMEDLISHSKSEHMLRLGAKLQKYMDGESKVNIYKKLI